MTRILVVEDENILRKNIVDRLRAEGHDLYDAGTAESAVELAMLLAPDLIITDLRLPGMDGIELLRRVRTAAPRTLVVIMTAVGTSQTAMEAIREGAYDYLNKPIELKELVYLVQRAVSHSRALDRVQYARAVERRSGTLDRFLGVSPAIRAIKHRVRQLLASPVTAGKTPPVILITGETGTGKSQLAHILHNDGPRRDGPFISIQCMASSEQEIEKELFGAGEAPTPEVARNKGIVDLAEGGTVFLEEVTGLSRRIQARLLAMLECSSTLVPGSDRPRTSLNVQFILTTTRDLTGELVAGRLIAEFYHRITHAVIDIPPLRERVADIPPLAESFLTLHAKRSGIGVPVIDASAMEAMLAYDWPGNARELSHAMERAVLVCDPKVVCRDDLTLGPVPAGNSVRLHVPDGGSVVVSFDDPCPTMAEIQRRVILAALSFFAGDSTKVAASLRVPLEKVVSIGEGNGLNLPLDFGSRHGR